MLNGDQIIVIAGVIIMAIVTALVCLGVKTTNQNFHRISSLEGEILSPGLYLVPPEPDLFDKIEEYRNDFPEPVEFNVSNSGEQLAAYLDRDWRNWCADNGLPDRPLYP